MFQLIHIWVLRLICDQKSDIRGTVRSGNRGELIVLVQDGYCGIFGNDVEWEVAIVGIWRSKRGVWDLPRSWRSSLWMESGAVAIGASVEITNVVSRWQPVDSIDEAFRWPSITMLSGSIRVEGHDCRESSKLSRIFTVDWAHWSTVSVLPVTLVS